MSENNVKDLKKKIFNVSDDLHMLYSSYESLQVITADSSAEAVHVCAVLDGLNYRFEALIKQLDTLYKQSDTDFIPVVVFTDNGVKVAESR